MSCSVIEVDLVCSDTEATDNNEVFCLAENFLSKFSLRSYPKYMYISAIVLSNAFTPRLRILPDLFNELVFRQGCL